LTDPRRKHLPPLVKGPPLINHTFIHLEAEFPWRLTQWRDQYGEIFRTKSAATDFIWLSSPKLVKDIIDKRSAIYSSRQPQPMALGAASGGKRMTFMPKGKQWRTLRAIIHRV
jgi:cytochrome P450